LSEKERDNREREEREMGWGVKSAEKAVEEKGEVEEKKRKKMI